MTNFKSKIGLALIYDYGYFEIWLFAHFGLPIFYGDMMIF